MKILKEPIQEIPVKDLKDGEIAIITEWSASEYVGRIVQRYGEHLVALGSSRGSSWPEFFNEDFSIRPLDNLKVRVLPKGTQIEL
jgi:hypothetical protein